MQRFNLLVFDIGGTNVRSVTVNEVGEIVRRSVVPAEQFAKANAVDFLADVILDQSKNTTGGIDGVVIGVPGIMDRSRRTVMKAPLVPSLEIDGFADKLEERCGVPVILDHDATMQLRGEALNGAAAGKELVLGVYFGTGVGAAFLDGGNLMGGPFRMQIGHVPLRGEGRIGTGGALDCVEAYASGVVLQSLAAEFGVQIGEVFTSEDAVLRERLQIFVSDQALTIAMAVTLTDPEVVVVGGGIVEMPGYPFSDLIVLVNEKLSPVVRSSSRLVLRAELGPGGATWGAVSLFQRYLKDMALRLTASAATQPDTPQPQLE